jgi:hypothetical protein
VDNAGKLMVLALVGVGGYLGYTQVLRPYLLEQELKAKAKALAAAKGISYQDALAQIGAAVCQKIVQYEEGGKPPTNLEKLGCSIAGKVAGVVVYKGGKLLVKGVEIGAGAVASGAEDVAHYTATGAKDVAHVTVGAGKAVANAVSKLKFWGVEGLSC